MFLNDNILLTDETSTVCLKKTHLKEMCDFLTLKKLQLGSGDDQNPKVENSTLFFVF